MKLKRVICVMFRFSAIERGGWCANAPTAVVLLPGIAISVTVLALTWMLPAVAAAEAAATAVASAAAAA